MTNKKKDEYGHNSEDEIEHDGQGIREWEKERHKGREKDAYEDDEEEDDP